MRPRRITVKYTRKLNNQRWGKVLYCDTHCQTYFVFLRTELRYYVEFKPLHITLLMLLLTNQDNAFFLHDITKWNSYINLPTTSTEVSLKVDLYIVDTVHLKIPLSDNLAFATVRIALCIWLDVSFFTMLGSKLTYDPAEVCFSQVKSNPNPPCRAWQIMLWFCPCVIINALFGTSPKSLGSSARMKRTMREAINILTEPIMCQWPLI